MSNKNNTATKTDETVVAKKPTTINVEENLKFESNMKSYFANTIELCQIINGLFADSFKDYCGCKISQNNGSMLNSAAGYVPMGKFFVTLYFKPNVGDADPDAIQNVIPKSTIGKGSTKFQSLMQMSAMQSGRQYEVTQKTYEALEEFVFPFAKQAFAHKNDPKTGDIIISKKWEQMTFETLSNFGYSASYNQEVVVAITGLDLEAMISKVYGTKDEDGRYQYQASPVQIVTNAADEYVVQVTQLDINKLDDLRRSLGGPISRTEYHEFIR